MKTAIQTFLAATLLLLAGCSGNLESNEVGIILSNQPIPPMVTGLSLTCGVNCVSVQFGFDVGSATDVLDKKGITYQLKLNRLTVGDDAINLVGVASMKILVVPTGGGTPVLLATYTRPTGTTTTHSITAESVSDVDLQPYVSGGVVQLQVQLVYDASAPASTATLEAVFWLKAHIDYAKAI